MLLFCGILAGSVLQVGAKAAKNLFGSAQTGSDQTPSAFGSYAKGCLAGADQLTESGPTWQVMRLSRNRNWGHPETINYIQKLSQRASNLRGWNGLYIGDISQPRGGPMLSGHASHQIGLDVDIWLRRADDLSLSRARREEISSTSLRRAKGA
ncbi:penicillin-insensitive murein endopeptidase, partial [bacterium]|nr:penicillin-insensitive murein endopeptidase [bacterium]